MAKRPSKGKPRSSGHNRGSRDGALAQAKRSSRGATTARAPIPNTERARPDAQIRRIREARIRAYIAKRAVLARGAELGARLGIFAEGDSWFEYPKGLDTGGSIIDHLQKKVSAVILNLAYRGDDVRLMLSLPQRMEITQRFADGVPAESRPFDIFLFSGEGNDLVGNQLCIWLRNFKTGMPASEIIDSERFNAVLTIVEAGYRDLFEIRAAKSPKTKVFLNSYDYAIPDGRGVCGYGPWLKPSLDFRGVPPALQRDVVKDMLGRFDARLRRVAAEYKDVFVVPTQGTLADAEWSNEIHPDRAGFDKLADRFAASLRSEFPRI